LALALASLVALGACGIRPDAAPREVPEEQRARFVRTGTSDATGAQRIYLVGPGDDGLLRSVPRNPDRPEELIQLLLAGPTLDELEAQFTTRIPATLELRSTRVQGTLVRLDVSEELAELQGPGLVQALAQIVYTANEIDGVEQVEIRVDGERVPWPKANAGDSTTGPLRIYDYPGMVRSAQPAYPSVPSGV
jgi:hypothetical protein